MAELALLLWLLYLGAAAVRIVLHLRRTGSTGLALGATAAPSRIARVAELAHPIALVIGFAAPLLDLADALAPVEALDRAGVAAAGMALYGLGLAGMVASQAAMGESWRIGTDPRERTLLVTHGPFALVRNPIYSSLVLVLGGLALLVPNAAALVSVALWTWAVETQVRRIEEPHLRHVHGGRWEGYAARVGRFVPWVGRLRGEPRRHDFV